MQLVSCKPGEGMAFEASPTPFVDQERHRLLLLVKLARDRYDLEFAAAEYCGYIQGLYAAQQITASVRALFQFEGHKVHASTVRRLDGEQTIRALAQITAEVSPCL